MKLSKSNLELEVVCHLSIDLGPGTGHFVVASDPVVYSFSWLVPVNLQTRQSVIIMSSVALNLKKCTALKYADIWSEPSLHQTPRTSIFHSHIRKRGEMDHVALYL